MVGIVGGLHLGGAGCRVHFDGAGYQARPVWAWRERQEHQGQERHRVLKQLPSGEEPHHDEGGRELLEESGDGTRRRW
eukprot:1856980-Pyramimonas_sp.AAC.2